jgi:FkbM family methyltransferase
MMMADGLVHRQYTPVLKREVWLRHGTSDQQVWSDTFIGLYHVPPDWMPPPETVLDLGANIGLTAAHYQVMWPHAEVVAVEMDESNVEMARMNFPGTVAHRAVGGLSGPARYVSSVRHEAFHLSATGDVQVQRSTLAQLVRKHFGQRVDFVKLDVEGEEHSILHHGESWRRLVRHLLVEVHEQINGYTWGDALRDLQNLGFQAERFERHPQAVFAWRPE